MTNNNNNNNKASSQVKVVKPHYIVNFLNIYAVCIHSKHGYS